MKETDSMVDEQLSAVLDVLPEMARTEQYEQLEKDLFGRIGNREYLTMDFDTDGRRLINRFIDQDGEVEELAFSE